MMMHESEKEFLIDTDQDHREGEDHQISGIEGRPRAGEKSDEAHADPAGE